jgi:hypothetical protein
MRIGGTLGIATDATKARRGEEWAANRELSLSPESIAKVSTWACFIDAASYALLSRTYTLRIRTVLPGPGNLIVSLIN